MRIPEKGELVLWYEHGDASAKPAAALVVDVSGQDLAVSVFSKYLNHQVTREAVLHMSLMHTVTVPRRAGSGGWDYCPRTLAMDAAINALSNRLEDLENRLAGNAPKAEAEPEVSEESTDEAPAKGGWTPERRAAAAENLAKARAAKKDKQTETVA